MPGHRPGNEGFSEDLFDRDSTGYAGEQYIKSGGNLPGLCKKTRRQWRNLPAGYKNSKGLLLSLLEAVKRALTNGVQVGV
jgi:hypothetical protein